MVNFTNYVSNSIKQKLLNQKVFQSTFKIKTVQKRPKNIRNVSQFYIFITIAVIGTHTGDTVFVTMPFEPGCIHCSRLMILMLQAAGAGGRRIPEAPCPGAHPRLQEDDRTDGAPPERCLPATVPALPVDAGAPHDRHLCPPVQTCPLPAQAHQGLCLDIIIYCTVCDIQYIGRLFIRVQ